jgi:micrococcal nuclease
VGWDYFLRKKRPDRIAGITPRKQPRRFARIPIAMPAGLAAGVLIGALIFVPPSSSQLGDLVPAWLHPEYFRLCHTGGGYNCVVDGDTFHYHFTRIRMADIDTPETHPPRCAYEAELGRRATERLQELLNQGPFTLRTIDRDEDQYGRKLRVVMRGGDSLGLQLVNEGLARRWTGRRRPWC